MPITRTAAILAAVTDQLEQRRLLLDRAEDLGEILIKVKMVEGTTRVRAIEMFEHHITRRTYSAT